MCVCVACVSLLCCGSLFCVFVACGSKRLLLLATIPLSFVCLAMASKTGAAKGGGRRSNVNGPQGGGGPRGGGVFSAQATYGRGEGLDGGAGAWPLPQGGLGGGGGKGRYGAAPALPGLGGFGMGPSGWVFGGYPPVGGSDGGSDEWSEAETSVGWGGESLGAGAGVDPHGRVQGWEAMGPAQGWGGGPGGAVFPGPPQAGQGSLHALMVSLLTQVQSKAGQYGGHGTVAVMGAPPETVIPRLQGLSMALDRPEYAAALGSLPDVLAGLSGGGGRAALADDGHVAPGGGGRPQRGRSPAPSRWGGAGGAPDDGPTWGAPVQRATRGASGWTGKGFGCPSMAPPAAGAADAGGGGPAAKRPRPGPVPGTPGALRAAPGPGPAPGQDGGPVERAAVHGPSSPAAWRPDGGGGRRAPAGGPLGSGPSAGGALAAAVAPGPAKGRSGLRPGPGKGGAAAGASAWLDGPGDAHTGALICLVGREGPDKMLVRNVPKRTGFLTGRLPGGNAVRAGWKLLRHLAPVEDNWGDAVLLGVLGRRERDPAVAWFVFAAPGNVGRIESDLRWGDVGGVPDAEPGHLEALEEAKARIGRGAIGDWWFSGWPSFDGAPMPGGEGGRQAGPVFGQGRGGRGGRRGPGGADHSGGGGGGWVPHDGGAGLQQVDDGGHRTPSFGDGSTAVPEDVGGGRGAAPADPPRGGGPPQEGDAGGRGGGDGGVCSPGSPPALEGPESGDLDETLTVVRERQKDREVKWRKWRKGLEKRPGNYTDRLVRLMKEADANEAEREVFLALAVGWVKEDIGEFLGVDTVAVDRRRRAVAQVREERLAGAPASAMAKSPLEWDLGGGCGGGGGSDGAASSSGTGGGPQPAHREGCKDEEGSAAGSADGDGAPEDPGAGPRASKDDDDSDASSRKWPARPAPAPAKDEDSDDAESSGGGDGGSASGDGDGAPGGATGDAVGEALCGGVPAGASADDSHAGGATAERIDTEDGRVYSSVEAYLEAKAGRYADADIRAYWHCDMPAVSVLGGRPWPVSWANGPPRRIYELTGEPCTFREFLAERRIDTPGLNVNAALRGWLTLGPPGGVAGGAGAGQWLPAGVPRSRGAGAGSGGRGASAPPRVAGGRAAPARGSRQPGAGAPAQRGDYQARNNPANMKDGDWVCGVCYALNYQWRSHCNGRDGACRQQAAEHWGGNYVFDDIDIPVGVTVGRFVGSEGANVRRIEDESGCSVRVVPGDRQVQVRSEPLHRMRSQGCGESALMDSARQAVTHGSALVRTRMGQLRRR